MNKFFSFLFSRKNLGMDEKSTLLKNESLYEKKNKLGKI